jgi:hypothetical protein
VHVGGRGRQEWLGVRLAAELVISLLAKRQFSSPGRRPVNDTDNRWFFDERSASTVVVSASSTLMCLIEETTGSPTTVRMVILAGAGST